MKNKSSKIILYLVPHLIYLSTFFKYYNVNFVDIIRLPIQEIAIVSFIFFIITNIIYIVIKNILKDNYKTYLIMCFIIFFYNIKFTLITFIAFTIFLMIFILELKYLFKFKLNKVAIIMSSIIISVFTYNFLITSYNVTSYILKNTSYENDINIKVNEELIAPNIYYIHCDGMMNFKEIEKYFGYNNQYLKQYLTNESFIINEDAKLISGYRTQRALVALFNPNYYDNFFNDYLIDLENYNLEKQASTKKIVDYYELEEKRLKNELFLFLKAKDYTTIDIGEYNGFTSLDADYYYDFYNYNSNYKISEKDDNFRLITNNIDNNYRKLYTRFIHSKDILSYTFLANLITDITPIKSTNINYQNIDTSNYPHINYAYKQNNYWIPQAILKGLEKTTEIDNHHFTFIDFNVNHSPFLFDASGNLNNKKDWYYLNNYIGNYIYSNYLLTDIINYIKDNDPNAIIFLQGDHGIHDAKTQDMKQYFNLDIEEIQTIRNSTISAYYIPKELSTGDEVYLNNPLNISRYIINNYISKNNYQYLSN